MNQYVTGSTIKCLREKAKLTQCELASLLNVSDKTVSKWENGTGLSRYCVFGALGTGFEGEHY